MYQSDKEEYGYNLTKGGTGFSDYWNKEENRQAQSERRKNYIKEHPESIQQLIKKAHTLELDKNHSKKMKENYQNENKNSLRKLNEQRKIKVRCIELNKIFNSQTEAANYCNTTAANIHQVLIGKRKIAGGYHWEKV